MHLVFRNIIEKYKCLHYSGTSFQAKPLVALSPGRKRISAKEETLHGCADRMMWHPAEVLEEGRRGEP